VENFSDIVRRIAAGEEVEIVAGPDDICTTLLGTADTHCSEPSIVAKDDAAFLAVFEALGSDLQHVRLDAATIASLRRRFAEGSIRSACTGCSWYNLCSRVADDGYVGATL